MNRQDPQLAICPKCKSWRVTEDRTADPGSNHRCQECGHEWSVSREQFRLNTESEKKKDRSE